MKRQGRGRRTRQYNQGAKTLGAYVEAVQRHTRGAKDAGGKIIHETPKDKRSEYAKQIWALRRRHGNPPIIKIRGQQYEVLQRTTRETHEEEGRPHLAAEMRKSKIAASLVIAKPAGDQSFGVNEYESGSYGILFVIPGVSARGLRHEIGTGSNPGQMVKVLGHSVREGSARHLRLLEDKKHYDDLDDSEHERKGPAPKKNISPALEWQIHRLESKIAAGRKLTAREAAQLRALRIQAGRNSNPLLESIVGGAAAGSAVVLMGKYLEKKMAGPKLNGKAANIRYHSGSFPESMAAAKKWAARAGRPTNLVITAYGWKITTLSPAYSQPAWRVYPDGRAEEITSGYRGQNAAGNRPKGYAGKWAIVADAVAAARKSGRPFADFWTYDLGIKDRGKFQSRQEFERLAAQAYGKALENPAGKPYAVIYRTTGETLSTHKTRKEADKAADKVHPSIYRYVGVEYTGPWDSKKNPTAMLVVRGHNWQQESYETGSPDVKERAKQLRKLGYKISVESMGSQVTSLGLMKLTLLTIHNPDDKVPAVSETRRNPDNGGAQMFRDFHGRGPSEVIELNEALMASGDYAALGDNPELWLRPVKGNPEKDGWGEAEIRFLPEDGVKLAVDPAGRQLFFVGGQQTVSVEELEQQGVDTSKRFIPLGDAHAISYLTEKLFDGYKSVQYAHRFGDETGELPAAVYDKETERIILVGGAYKIAAVEAGLGASPGIVN